MSIELKLILKHIEQYFDFDQDVVRLYVKPPGLKEKSHGDCLAIVVNELLTAYRSASEDSSKIWFVQSEQIRYGGIHLQLQIFLVSPVATRR